MGKINIQIFRENATHVMHITTLGTQTLREENHGLTASRNAGYRSNMQTAANSSDGDIRRIDEFCEDVLRIPSKGYTPGIYSIPRNNIIIQDVNNKFFIEFIDVKCKVTKQNTIVETAVVNHNGTVKEFINAMDYAITISGNVIIDDKYNFPVNEMRQLNELLSQSVNLKVESVYLNLFNITQMVFKQGDFDQGAAKYINALPFTLLFVSDTDYNFLVENN